MRVPRTNGVYVTLRSARVAIRDGCAPRGLCMQYARSMYAVCTQYVRSRCAVCTQYAHSMYVVCAQYVHSMYNVCTQYVCSMCAVCMPVCCLTSPLILSLQPKVVVGFCVCLSFTHFVY